MKNKKKISLSKICPLSYRRKTIFNSQSGQMLVSSIFFLGFLSFFLIFFLFISEAYIRNYSNVNIARNEVLKQNTQLANILNEISINNRLVIISLSVAESAFLQASELGLYIAYAQPYWKTYSTFQKSKNEAMFDSYLSDESMHKIQDQFLFLQEKSARGLYYAKSLVQKNKKLLNQLPFEIAKYFNFSSNAASFCIALKSLDHLFANSGNFSFPILEKSYPFLFHRKNCTLLHKRNGFMQFSDKIPILSTNISDEFLILEKLKVDKSKIDYGVLYVPFDHVNDFLNNLSFFAKKEIEYQKNYAVIFNYIKKIFEFDSVFGLNLKLYSKIINVKVTHPNVECQEKNRKIVGNLMSNNLKQKSACIPSRNNFLFSFFLPHWIALISSEKDKNIDEN